MFQAHRSPSRKFLAYLQMDNIYYYIYCMYIYTPLYIPYCKPLYIYHIVYHYTIYIYCIYIYIYHIVYHYIPYIYIVYIHHYIYHIVHHYIYIYHIVYHYIPYSVIKFQLFAFNFPILPSSFDIYEANSLMLTLSRQEPQEMSEAGALELVVFFWGGVPFWETVMSPKVPSYPQVVRLIIENRR